MNVFLIMLMLAGVCLLTGFLMGRSLRWQKNLGEALVAETIARGFRRPHALINNVTLEAEGGTTQIDHVLVADTGIFVIETKHYQGWIFGRPADPHWTQVIYRRKARFLNPLRQNEGHLRAVRSLFNLPPEAFFGVVVFSGDAEFKTDCGPSVLKLCQLTDYLSTGRPTLFDERKMAYIVGRIEMKRLRRSVETDEHHLNSLRRRLGKQMRSVAN